MSNSADGRLADDGELDGSDFVTSQFAARRFLALHASTFFHGKVPHAAQSESSAYHIRAIGQEVACYSSLWAVVVYPGALAAATILGAAYADDIKSITNEFAAYLSRSIRAIIASDPYRMPLAARIEPVLPVMGGNGGPLVDIEAEAEKERFKLYDVGTRVLLEVARPVGRSADTLRAKVDTRRAAVIDASTKARLAANCLEDDITDAVSQLRAKLANDHPGRLRRA